MTDRETYVQYVNDWWPETKAGLVGQPFKIYLNRAYGQGLSGERFVVIVSLEGFHSYFKDVGWWDWWWHFHKKQRKMKMDGELKSQHAAAKPAI
jgi:hypothetical protein